MLNNEVSFEIRFSFVFLLSFRLLTVLLDTTTSTIANDTSDSRTADTKDRNSYPFVIILPTIILIILLSISAFIAWKKKWRMRCRGSKGCVTSIPLHACYFFLLILCIKNPISFYIHFRFT